MFVTDGLDDALDHLTGVSLRVEVLGIQRSHGVLNR